MNILLIIYDNESDRHVLPLGAAYVAATLVKEGYNVDYFNQDALHYSEAELYSYLLTNDYDIIGLGFIGGYFQHDKIIKICKAINKLDTRPKLVLGGHGPSPAPEYFMRVTGADSVVIGEGEITFLEYVKAIENNSDLSSVDGIAFKTGEGHIIVNKQRTLIKDINSIPWPYLDKLPMEYYLNSRWPPAGPTDRVAYMIISRGCYYSCNFCYRMEKGVRYRDLDDVIEEIKYYKKVYRITYISFQDELLIGAKKQTIKFCERLIQEDLNVRWDCMGRLNVVTPEVLGYLKKAGCLLIGYGIEMFDNESLKKMDKDQTEEEIIKGVENTREAGINIAFNLIFGNLGDTKESLQKSLTFFMKYNDFTQLRTIRPVTPYPGSKLFKIGMDKGLIKGPEDFYKRHKNADLMTVNFTNLTDEEYYRILLEANKKMVSCYFEKQADTLINKFKNLYYDKDFVFRGPRHSTAKD